MEKETIRKFEEAIYALKGAVEDCSRLRLPLVKEELYAHAFDTGKVYITPASYSVDRSAADYEVELTEEEKAVIRDMVLPRIIQDEERQKRYLDELADKVCSVVFDRH